MTTPSRLAWMVAVPFLLVTGPAGAHIAGGGPAASDCYARFEGIDATSGVRVDCTDGDPTCDHDGECGNGCTFEVEVCAFTGGGTGCTPQTVTGFPVNSAGLTLPPTPVTSETCAATSQIPVPLKRNGKKAGKRVVKLVAQTDGKPKKDKDKLQLRCLPRSGTCPEQLPVTSTTTTVTSASSTTRFTTTQFTGSTTTSTSATTTTCPPNGLGVRHFSVANGTDPAGSHFYTSVTGSRVEFLNSVRGSLDLCGGVVDPANGVTSLALNADGVFGWKVIDGSFVCVKVLAAGSSGKLDCNGGTPVDMRFYRDSHGEGDNEPETTETELGNPGAAGAGYIMAPMQIVNCPDDEACPAALTSADDCANPQKVNYSVIRPSFHGLTTGSLRSEIVNPIQGGIVGITRVGQPFNCSAWTTEDGPGTLEMAILGVDTGRVGDVANIAQIDD
jgi:hypothetical protein